MRSVLLLAALAACAHAPAPCPSPVTAKRIDSPAPAPPIAPPSKAEITTRSHDLLDAYDRGELAKVEPLLSAALVHFEGGKPRTRDDELAGLRKRKPDGPYIASRVWSDEHVEVSADQAVFVGKATETQGGNAKHGGYQWSGWYMLAWGRDAETWKLRVWTWQRAGKASERTLWNEIFRNDSGFEKQPNKLLVEVTKGMKPGTALDLAMGQGRNALYLASIGWKTTGIDFADEGVQIARAEAAKRKLELSTINADIDSWDFGTNRWDLISMIYPGDNHEPWIEKAKLGLKHGGLFVLEFFAGDAEHPTEGGYLPGQLAQAFATGFTILRDDTVEDTPDWAIDHAKLVRFVARKNR
jgi:SAM-dependent methyltransferase